MDWANERYVRVYTRDSETWLELSWEARALLVHVLRKVERSGLVEARNGARSVARIVSMPLAVVERSLPELLGSGCLAPHPLGFVVPNFIEAQETPQSDRHRARESRARRRERSSDTGPRVSVTNRDSDVTNCDAVTKRDVTITERDSDITNRDANVTRGHAASRGVTERHSLQTLQTLQTDPDQKERETLAAGARAIPVARTAQHGAPEYGQPDPVQTLARRACGETLWDAHQAARKAVGVLLGQAVRDLPATDQGRTLLQDRIRELTLTMPLAEAERVCREVLERTEAESQRDKTLRYLTGQLWDKRRFDTAVGLLGEPVSRKPINGHHAPRSGLAALLDDIAAREARGEK